MAMTCSLCGTFTTDRKPIRRVFAPGDVFVCDRCARKQATKRGLAEVLDDQIRRQYDPAYTSPLFPDLLKKRATGDVS